MSDTSSAPRRFFTVSGLPVDCVYEPPSGPLPPELGRPGEYPYTRGIYPTMYRGRPWTIRQYSGFSTAEESNKRYRYLLERGGTGLSVAFDLPTQIGYDSDHSLADGEVGKVGVAIDTVEDMHALFDGIPLDQVSTSMTINSTAAILLAMYIVVAEERGISRKKLSGTIQNDILKEYIARGTYRFPPRPSLRLVCDTFGFCAREMPKWNPISISGYHIREAGSTAIQEIAFTLADAICYIETALSAGLAIDDFAPRLSFFFAAHTDFFEEAAKFRAARRLYARIMKERFNARDPKSLMLRFHTQTGGVTLTAQQPDNNIVRVTIQALAAVLGGTQSLHTNAKDEALSLPTEHAAQIAIRTQQIIAEESGVTATVDPLGGSYFVENLTDRLETEAAALIAEIDRMGGMVSAIESGWVQRQIEKSAYAFGQSLEKNERIIVGVNKYRLENEPAPEIFKVPSNLSSVQAEKLRRIRSERDANRVKESLDRLEQAARTTENLMPLLIETVRARASIGEICNTLEKIFGLHEQI